MNRKPRKLAVFVPIFLLSGVGKYLFAPLARIPSAPEALRHPHLVRLIPILDLRAIQAQRKLWTGATLKCEIADTARPTHPDTSCESRVVTIPPVWWAAQRRILVSGL
jgi:hypothetical protein